MVASDDSRCKATTWKGKQCTKRPKPGSSYCHAHRFAGKGKARSRWPALLAVVGSLASIAGLIAGLIAIFLPPRDVETRAVRLIDDESKPVEGLRVSSRGSDTISLPTNDDGCTRVPLTAELRLGARLCIVLIDEKAQWQLLDPRNGCLEITEAELTERSLTFVIGRRGNEALYRNPWVVTTLAELIIEKSTSLPLIRRGLSMEERRSLARQEVAAAFDLDASDLGEAILSLRSEASQPYHEAIAKLYAAEFSDASSLLRSLEGTKERRVAVLLGQVLMEEGRYKEAVQSYRDALKSDGDIEILHALTAALYAANELGEAEATAREVYNSSLEQFGEKDLFTVTSAVNLAAVMQQRGDLAVARQLLTTSVPLLEEHLGSEHRETLVGKSNLAHILWRLGDLAEARRIQIAALNVQKRVLPRCDPDIFQSMNTLAAVFLAQGRCEEARPIAERVVQGRSICGAEAHPDTLIYKNALAVVRTQKHDFHGAMAMINEILASFEQLGAGQSTPALVFKSNRARLFQLQGDLIRARELQEEVLAAQRLSGEDNPHTLTTKYHLAETLRLQEYFSEARALQQEVLEARESKLGVHHPDTLRSHAALVRIELALGELVHARQRAEETVRLQEEVLGVDHPSTNQTRWDLIQVLIQLGEVEEAKRSSRKIEWLLAADPAVLCEENIDIRQALSRFGRTLA